MSTTCRSFQWRLRQPLLFSLTIFEYHNITAWTLFQTVWIVSLNTECLKVLYPRRIYMYRQKAVSPPLVAGSNQTGKGDAKSVAKPYHLKFWFHRSALLLTAECWTKCTWGNAGGQLSWPAAPPSLAPAPPPPLPEIDAPKHSNCFLKGQKWDVFFLFYILRKISMMFFFFSSFIWPKINNTF